MTKLLIADDDVELCQLLAEYLSAEAFEVAYVHDGQQAIEQASTGNFDLLILDVMMPKVMGFDVLNKLRKTTHIPIIMLTARGDDIDRIVGLELGADDYLPKPCNPRELLARLRAILRRSDLAKKPEPIETIEVAGITLNSATREVYYQQQALTLTSAEFNILQLLLLNAGKVVSKESLTEKALGRKLSAYDRSVDVHVSKIRKKLQAIAGDKQLISNIRGSGYQLKKPE